MKLVTLTKENVKNYIGYNIIFKSNNNYIIKKIIKSSVSGKSITIDYSKLNNCLEIVSRNIFVIID